MDNCNVIGIDFIERLSGGNHELFHSNLLAFLAKHETEFFKKLFKCGEYSIEEIGREEDHLDLSLYNKDGKKVFILENKMKSLPSRSQLQRYAKRNKKDSTRDCKFVLLTLIEPAWKFEPGEEKWEIITYQNLIKEIQDYLKDNTLSSRTYLNCFLHDYVCYVNKVVSMIAGADKLIDNDQFRNFTVEDYCKYGDVLNHTWEKNLAKRALAQACLKRLLKETNNVDIFYQTIYNHGETGFEILIPLYPEKHSEDNHSDMFFIHLQGKKLNRGFRIYTPDGKAFKGTKRSKIKDGLTKRGEFLKTLWNENMDDVIPKMINEALKSFKINIDSYENTGMYAYIFDEFVMPYINSENINENSLLIDVLDQMKSEIKTVLKICKDYKEL